MKKIISVLMVCVMLLVMVGCNSSNGNNGGTEKLIVVTSPDYAPFEFINPQTQEIVGSDIELAKYIAKELGMELELQTAAFDLLVEGVASGKYPVAISGFTFNESRAQQANFSDAYYTEGFQGMLIKEVNLDVYTSVETFAGKYVNAQSGSIQAEIAEQFLSEANVTPVTLVTDGVQNLLSGKIDGLVIASMSGEAIIAANPGLAMAPFQFEVESNQNDTFVIVNKNETELLEKINAIIAKVVEEGLYAQWHEEAKQLQADLGVE